MPTLQEITLAHSQRLSDLYRGRDLRIAEVQALRDAELRANPALTKTYQKYDEELSSAREKQLATDYKAEAARSAALLIAVDRRTDRLEDAQMTRRSEDINAVALKRRSDEAANRKYEAAVSALAEVASRDRQKAAQDAERDRRADLDQARKAHDAGLMLAQQHYRDGVDEALQVERRDSRDAERAYLDAVRVGESAARSAKASADQALADALSKLPDAAATVRVWRTSLRSIAADVREGEQEAFARFRRELDSIKT